MIPYERNKPYNHLPLLPPTAEVLTKEVLVEWGLATRALAELNKNVLRLPNPNILINTISLQEAKSSTEIENIFTTEDELYKAISDSINEQNATPNTKEVLRYREALWAGYADIKTKNRIDLDAIIKIYQKVKNTTQGVRPPQSQVVIKRGNSELRPGEVIYTPPRGKEVLEEKINNLESYLNTNQDDIDPLIKMAIIHYQFEAIHPFTDGNGRTGRILNLLYLVNSDLLSQPVLYLSKYIIENKNDYYYYLGLVSERKAWTEWIIFMMKAVRYTAIHSNKLIDQIVDQMAATLEYGKKELNWYSKEVNEAVFSQPYIKQATFADILGRTSRTTLTKYFSELVKCGIVSHLTDKKEVYYINNDLVRILEGN